MGAVVLEQIKLTEKEKGLLDELRINGCGPRDTYLGRLMCHEREQCKEANKIFRKMFQNEPTTIHTLTGNIPRCIYDVLKIVQEYKAYIQEGAV